MSLINDRPTFWFFSLALILFLWLAIGGRPALERIFFRQDAVMNMKPRVAQFIRLLAVCGSVADIVALLQYLFLRSR